MTDNQKTDAPRPVVARAAENGLYISIFICVLLLLLGAGTSQPLFAQLFLVGAVAMPFIAYRIMSRNCKQSGGTMSFIEIWAEGIVSFFLGSLIPAVMAYLLLRFAYPGFIYDQVQTTIEVLSAAGNPDMEAFADTIAKIRDAGNLPTPANIAANIISFNIIAGTLLSLLLAIVLSTRQRLARMRN